MPRVEAEFTEERWAEIAAKARGEGLTVEEYLRRLAVEHATRVAAPRAAAESVAATAIENMRRGVPR